MEIISNPFSGTPKKQRRGNRKNKVKAFRFGGPNARSRRFRLTPKLASPLKLWLKLKNAYMNMMVKLAANLGTSKSGNMFGAKRIPKVRRAPKKYYSRTEFENRLIHEIYKSMVASLELSSTGENWLNNNPCLLFA